MKSPTLKKKSRIILISVFRFALIGCLCYVILYPFIAKTFASFMSPNDLLDSTVQMIPKHWSLYFWKYAWGKLNVPVSGLLSLELSVISGLLQVFVSAFVGYGLARFDFKGKNLAFVFVVLMLMIPSQVYSIAQYLNFRYFGFGSLTISLLDSQAPVYILAIGCLSIKEGLYIYLMRELFLAMPKDLENAAYIDGASVMGTYFRIILPNARSMMLTIFLFAFCWQWTDSEFSSLYFSGKSTLAMRPLMPSLMEITVGATKDTVSSGIARNTAVLIIIIPLVALAVICQKFLTKSISQTGLAN